MDEVYRELALYAAIAIVASLLLGAAATAAAYYAILRLVGVPA